MDQNEQTSSTNANNANNANGTTNTDTNTNDNVQFDFSLVFQNMGGLQPNATARVTIHNATFERMEIPYIRRSRRLQQERAGSNERNRDYMVEYYNRNRLPSGVGILARRRRVVLTTEIPHYIPMFEEENSGGLTRKEINSHTIAYKYMTKKRRRVNTEASSSSSSTTTENDNNKDDSPIPNKIHNNSESSNNSGNDSCTICLDSFSNNSTVRRLPCLHLFHTKCVDKWLQENSNCPICRIGVCINYEDFIPCLQGPDYVPPTVTRRYGVITTSLNEFQISEVDNRLIVNDILTSHLNALRSRMWMSLQ